MIITILNLVGLITVTVFVCHCYIALKENQEILLDNQKLLADNQTKISNNQKRLAVVMLEGLLETSIGAAGFNIMEETETNTFDIDSLLDKINKSGIDSLTADEKEFLNKQ